MKILVRLSTAAVFVLTSVTAVQAQGPASPSPTPAIQTGGEVAAQTALEVWLGLVDDARFSDSWTSAAKIFQKAIDREKWASMLDTYRAPMGKLLSRKRKASQFAKTLPGAPDGQYVVIQYDTVFEHKATAVETVSSVLDTDGQWKVCGYFVR